MIAFATSICRVASLSLLPWLQSTMRDLGKLGCAKKSNCAFDGGRIEVGPGFTTATEHEMSVGIAGGFQDSRGRLPW